MNTVKHLLRIALATAVLSMPLSANADVFGKIGKALGKANKALNQVNNALGNNKQTTNNSNRTTQQTGTQRNANHGPLEGLDIKFLSCERWGDGTRSIVSFTNTTNRDMAVNFASSAYENSKEIIIIDNFGVAHKGRLTTIGELKLSLGSTSFSFPAGVTIKGTYEVRDVGKEVTSFKQLTLPGFTIGKSPAQKFCYTWSDVPITEVKNTNDDRVTCTLPVLSLNYTGIERSGQNVVISFTLTNTTNSDMYIQGSRVSVYSDSGDSFDSSCYQGDREFNGYNLKALPSGVPVKYTVVISNVPETITSFSLMRLTFTNDHKIEFRNLTL